MSYLEKLLEGYFAGLTTPIPRDRAQLQHELGTANDPITRGNLLGELALALAMEAWEPRALLDTNRANS